MCSFPFLRWVALLVASLFWIGVDSQLRVEPIRIRTGGKLCSNTNVYFTCVANNVRVLQWLRNGEQIAQFTNQDMPSTEPEVNDPFRIYLNSSENDGQNNLNVTSTLVGPASGFQSGDRIFCPDNAGDPFILNFTTTTPVPDGFQVSVSRDNTDDTLYLDIRWNSAFNVMYGIESYQLEASSGLVSCPQMCPSNASGPCRCSGLTAEMDGNITITATTCGDQQGLPAVVYLTPRVPDRVSSCFSYPVYNASNRLYQIETTWTQVPNPRELTTAVSQNILDYSVSFDEKSTLTNCTSSSCSLNVQPIASLSTVSVAARNVIGRGQERICNLSPSVNSQTNDVFTITLSSTSLNRSVACKRLMPEQLGMFSCRFCIETCYDLENSTSNSEANAALTRLVEGAYLYNATAFLNGVPLASISDVFSTACQLGELGATDEDSRTNSSCLSIPNGRVCLNGTTAGSVAMYFCNDGFMLTGSGSSQRTCRSDGLWEGGIPSCDATDSVPRWVIAISVILPVIFLIVVISIIVVIIVGCRFSKNKNESGIEVLSYSHESKPADAEELKEKQKNGDDTGDGSEPDDSDPHKELGKQRGHIIL